MKLKNIKIKNFKSLKNIDINLEYLTLITGVNSSGKSSLIQALLLLKENTSILNLISQGYKQFEEIGINTNLNSGKYAILGYKKYLLTYDSTDDNI
ncbi:AAA family ATPase, partial [Candidatus Venteria ishoeyi]